MTRPPLHRFLQVRGTPGLPAIRLGLAAALALGSAAVTGRPCDAETGQRAAAAERLAEARQRAVAWLETCQLPEGSFVAKGLVPFLRHQRAFQVWETIVVLQALSQDLTPAAADSACGFLGRETGNDGLTDWRGSRRGGVCPETTSLLYLAAPCPELASIDATCAMLAARTDDRGRIPYPEFRSASGDNAYPSTSGFALLVLDRCPEFPRAKRRALVRAARTALRRPQAVGRAWQAYGTEYYALYYCAWGLSEAGELRRRHVRSLLRYVSTQQRQDGCIVNGGPQGDSRTSEELATLLALNALAVRPPDSSLDVLRRGLAFLLDRQRDDGSFDGGFFRPGVRKEDLYATALWVELVDRLAARGVDLER
jgi:hypothetical protein